MICFYTGFFHLFKRVFHADGIPFFKGPHFPTETGAECSIDFVNFIRDFGYAVRYVAEQTVKRFSVKLACFVHSAVKHWQALSEVWLAFGHLQSWECGFFLLSKFQCFKVER